MARQALHQWIGEALSDPERVGSDGKVLRCTAIALMHSQGMSVQEVLNVKLTRPRDDKELADLFERRARNYAQDLPGVQTFCLYAFYEGSNEPGARRAFTVTPDADGSTLVTEAPNGQGSLQQHMRQKDDLHSIYINGIQSLCKMQMAFIGEIGMQNLRLASENRQLTEMGKTLLIERETKEHENRLTELKYQRSTQMQKQIMQALPSVVNQVAGREVFSQSHADTQLIEMMAEKATPQLIAKFGDALSNESPELVGALMSRFAQVQEAKREAQEENTRALAGLAGTAEDELQ